MDKKKGQNPKDLLGVKKVPMHLVPPTATIHEAMALRDGASKYGPYNWRDNCVIASIYIDACKRHIDAWIDGEEVAEDSGVHHLGHARACLAIILDALENGTLDDDRPAKGAASALLARMSKQIADQQEGLDSGQADRNTHPVGQFVSAHWLESIDPDDTARQGWVIELQPMLSTMTVLGESGTLYTCSDRGYAVVCNPPPVPAHVSEVLYGL